jgi:hypothetical protein
LVWSFGEVVCLGVWSVVLQQPGGVLMYGATVTAAGSGSAAEDIGSAGSTFAEQVGLAEVLVLVLIDAVCVAFTAAAAGEEFAASAAIATGAADCGCWDGWTVNLSYMHF